MSNAELEEGNVVQLDWQKLRTVVTSGQAVIPAVAQDVETGAVLIVGYANAEALEATLAQRCAVFWSTSRNELWVKGATSGHRLELVEVRVNCEQNALLYRVRRTAGRGACHTTGEDGTARVGCFYRVLEEERRLRMAADAGGFHSLN